MKKLLFGTLLSSLVLVVSIPTMARVDVDVSIGLPIIEFAAPPAMIVLPETDVYVVPDVDMDIFFYGGWWWRPWEGRWYRSRDYNSGWTHYNRVPSFYRQIPSDWRNDYREHHWKGHQWNYQRIPHQDVQQTWNAWEKSKYWEKHKTWDVQGLQPRTRSQQSPREVQSRQSRPQSREVKQERSQQYHGPGAQSPKGHSQHSQQQQGNHESGKNQQKNHKNGEEENQGRR